MTKRPQLRSRLKGNLSSRVLKTSGGGDKPAEFNPVKHRTRCKTFFGFGTGDMVSAILPFGKFAGTHVGRLTVRESGVFAPENATRQG
jgi:hypothetical protein